ncbi:MAG: NYN domain-containing protein, partial [Alphaproteobacteria bacterium]
MQENKAKHTYIYIDGANLHRGVISQNWKIDYKRFFVWLSEKYKTRKIYLFLGYLKKQNKLYNFLKKCGYILVFKETLVLKDGTTKGNCDAELVIQALEDFYEEKDGVNMGILVSGDGDFACLIDFWMCKK